MHERNEEMLSLEERCLNDITPERLDAHIAEAQKARDETAINHRGFLVGCSVVSVNGIYNGAGDLKVLAAGNYTPEDKKKSPEGKWCAERIAVNLALNEGGVFIPAIVSVSKETDRGEREHDHGVLHPCPECRILLRHLLQEGILHPKSKICNANDANPNQIIIQQRTVQELLDLYKDDEQDGSSSQ